MTPGENEPNLETVSSEDAVNYMQAKLAEWDFKIASEEQNAAYLTQIGHWALETFGQCNSDGEWFLYPRSSYGEGFDHEELPFDLQQIVMSEHYGEVYVGNNNSIDLSSKPLVLEDDPVIPNWDEISKLTTFKEQLQAIRSNPDVLDGLQQSKFLIVPGMQLNFHPATHFRWGLQFIVQSTRIDLVPYGEFGKTEVAFQYAAERRNDKLAVALTMADLLFLAVKYAQTPRVIPVDQLYLLEKRVNGEASIPLEGLNCQPKPGNSMKSLLVSEALQLGPEEA